MTDDPEGLGTFLTKIEVVALETAAQGLASGIENWPVLRSAIRKVAPEIARLRRALSEQNAEIEQTLGRSLGYPRFADDQVNFPGATGPDVCVGDHIAESLADEAAAAISETRAILRLAYAGPERLSLPDLARIVVGKVLGVGGAPRGERLVRERERHAITGIARTTAWELESRGEFPRRVVVAGNRVGWRLSELEEWVRSRGRA